jgi:hypothetical protein
MLTFTRQIFTSLYSNSDFFSIKKYDIEIDFTAISRESPFLQAWDESA